MQGSSQSWDKQTSATTGSSSSSSAMFLDHRALHMRSTHVQNRFQKLVLDCPLIKPWARAIFVRCQAWTPATKISRSSSFCATNGQFSLSFEESFGTHPSHWKKLRSTVLSYKILPPSVHQESKQWFESTPGNRTRNLSPRRPRTNQLR